MTHITDRAIRVAYFVEWDIPDYMVLRFSDFYRDYDIAGNTYDRKGSLLSITTPISEMRASRQEINIALSGLPADNATAAMQEKLRGSTITVYRGLFAQGSDTPLTPIAIRFKGIVNSPQIDENWSIEDRTSSYTLLLQCTSKLTYYQNRTTGQRTNPLDRAKWFPNDSGMSRVHQVKNANFNFGVPLSQINVGTQ